MYVTQCFYKTFLFWQILIQIVNLKLKQKDMRISERPGIDTVDIQASVDRCTFYSGLHCTDKLMSLGKPQLASTHPKINFSVWKSKHKNG